MRAIILAGGKGTRLLPYTLDVPKPLLPLLDKPALEIILEQLYLLGFEKVTLCIHYLAEVFLTFVKNRQARFKDMEIECILEREPLGTAGAVGAVDFGNEPNLVMNGDVITNLNFKKLLEFHRGSEAILTIAAKKYSTRLDVGAIEINEENRIISYTEKPEINKLISMGVYIFSPEVKRYIKPDEYLDFPQLVSELIRSNEKVLAFNSDALWLHLVSRYEYEKAREFFEQNWAKFFEFTT